MKLPLTDVGSVEVFINEGMVWLVVNGKRIVEVVYDDIKVYDARNKHEYESDSRANAIMNWD